MNAFRLAIAAVWALAGSFATPSLAAEDVARPKASTTTKALSTPARNKGVIVKRVRVGRHKTKTRIVLDLSAPAEFDYQIGDAGRTILLLLPGVNWKGAQDLRLKGNRNIDRIDFYPNCETGGGVLSIQARYRIGLSEVLVLGPWKHWGHRIALDIPYDHKSAAAPPGGAVRAGRIYPPRAKPAAPRKVQKATSRPNPATPQKASAAPAAKPEPPKKAAPAAVPKQPPAPATPKPPSNLY